MTLAYFISHPEVTVDSQIPVERWRLSNRGIGRMRAFARRAPRFDAIWASSEAKAIEAAGILAAEFGLPVHEDARLGENDRSATGFLPPEEFNAVADAFFANPAESIRGWERAVDAQARIVQAVSDLVETPSHGSGTELRTVAVVAHGGVGTLLLCHLLGVPISRELDQPHQGHFFVFDPTTHEAHHRWRSIDAR